MIRALIFDFDGTVIDTETAWYVAFRDAYKEYGVELTLEQYSQCIGTSLNFFNPYEYLVTDLHLPIDLDKFRISVQTCHANLMKTEQVRPGIVHFLKSARDQGLKIGLASSSKLDWVNRFLDRLELRDYFQCIRTADDVMHVKPHPELYLQTLNGLGIDGHEAIAIEDSPNGYRAAITAGLHCVVVPNIITQSLKFGPVLHTALSLEEFDFKQLLASCSECAPDKLA
ncbi:HAD family hydrolase [Desulfosporosinus shakirovi]|uniref:HAD family hydrolase n=1 Tax=Desulfosporosinus shakirovi TaxID=2885154 RepID=UPI001E2E29F4|nr:HAD-IA family hydrolase [Desulfosporosinus sp. SRJS8]MCB8817666.1 HAD-IA family hydrolase [Desulfosporosinus sp. SRJS8]